MVDSIVVDVFSPRGERRIPHQTRAEGHHQRRGEPAGGGELGDLPLALEQAGALQAETGMATGEYLELLREHTRDLLAESKPSEYPVSMTAAWRICVAQLTEGQPGALELLRCCAFFGPDPIPRDVFRRGIVQPGRGSARSSPTPSC